ncbi:bifunctional diaminohydroxyphosphoribosylaminopyrimidine deaminase/5-amino-6-(5-phosphoribosylamino)uracil reductase RibD [candidate division WOR-3 bacterium]|nr:bifunctional diaminohydroxyphosphoribosylaminopyrimidine deaminase/5-amino-6-(5-phosphoribosylamino)uracil reductase RibD [candidate division WOR-3 bacterium]
MTEALDLARRGRGRVSPNPMVGAVLVRDGKVVGRGWHRRFGGPHAEVETIADAGSKARGATLYVTMEPCCFHGKTPACTHAVRLAGIKRVVVATLDPNPRVNGRGMRCLREADIETSVGLLAGEARRLNEGYFTSLRKHRPFVILKVAATLDGMVADATGHSKWITGPKARAIGRELRLGADAIVVGVGTVIADNPRLTRRTKSRGQYVRVILDSELSTPLKSLLFTEPGPILIFTSSNDASRAECFWAKNVEVVRVSEDDGGLLKWKEILAELHRRQVQTVLIEGGATVASSALEAGVVDKMYVFQSPRMLGPGRLFTSGIAPRPRSHPIQLVRVEHRCLGRDFLTEGYVHRAH